MSLKAVHSEASCSIVVRKFLSKRYFVLNSFGKLFLLLSLLTSTCIHALVPTKYGYTKKNKFVYSYLPSIPNINYSSCMNSCSTFSTNGNQPITIYLNGAMTIYPSMTTWISYALCSPNAMNSYCDSPNSGSWGDPSNNGYQLKDNAPLFSNGGLTNAFPNALYTPMQLTYALENDVASCYCKSGLKASAPKTFAECKSFCNDSDYDVLSTNDVDMMKEVIEALTPSITGITSEECSSMNDNTCNSDDDHNDDDVNRAATPSGNVHSIAWIEETQSDNFIPFITNDQIMIDNNRTVIVYPTSQILLTAGGTLYTAVNPNALYKCACQKA